MTVNYSLGTTLPPSEIHAVSVSLPFWQDVVDYEEGNPRVISQLHSGYPRFVVHQEISKLTNKLKKELKIEEECFIFPSFAAHKCAEFLSHAQCFVKELDLIADFKLGMVCVHKDMVTRAKQYWQHTGTGISSRLAQYINEEHTEREYIELLKTGQKSLTEITHRLSMLYNIQNTHVHVCLSGMTSIYLVLQYFWHIKPSLRTIQFGFPYLDTLKLQERFGHQILYYSKGTNMDIDDLESLLERGERFSCLICEIPSNPLLKSPSLFRLAELCQRYDIAIVVDDTLSNFRNTHLINSVDVIVTSLTKIFSGGSNVMGGSVVVNEQSKHASTLNSFIQQKNFPVWWEDLKILEQNSRNLDERIEKSNKNAEILANFLSRRSEALKQLVSAVFYPKYDENYLKFSNNSYGSLLSFVLKDEDFTPKVFDSLQVCKGPSLGTNFTLACPYALLAHYNELDKVEKEGVSRWIIRVSVGLEDSATIVEAFRRALDSSKKNNDGHGN